jgi:hypothetical protein
MNKRTELAIRIASELGQGRIKIKLEPTALDFASSEGNSVTLEMQPTAVEFSSSEFSSEMREEPEQRVIYSRERNAAFARLLKRRNLNSAERRFVLAALRTAYTIPTNYLEFRDMIADAAEPFSYELAEVIRKGNKASDTDVYKAWSKLEYLLNHDERDPREVLVEYGDAVTDAMSGAIKTFNKSEHEGEDVSESVAESISDSFLKPYQDAPALHTASMFDDERREVKISSEVGPKLVLMIKRILKSLPPIKIKKPEIVIDLQPIFPKTRMQIGWEMTLYTLDRGVKVQAMFVLRRFSDKSYVVSLIAREYRGDKSHVHNQDFKAASLDDVKRAVKQSLLYVAQLVGRTLGAVKAPSTNTTSAKPVVKKKRTAGMP